VDSVTLVEGGDLRKGGRILSSLLLPLVLFFIHVRNVRNQEEDRVLKGFTKY